MKKIISFRHISLGGFVAGPNGEMNWIKVDEEIFRPPGLLPTASNCLCYPTTLYLR